MIWVRVPLLVTESAQSEHLKNSFLWHKITKPEKEKAMQACCSEIAILMWLNVIYNNKSMLIMSPQNWVAPTWEMKQLATQLKYVKLLPVTIGLEKCTPSARKPGSCQDLHLGAALAVAYKDWATANDIYSSYPCALSEGFLTERSGAVQLCTGPWLVLSFLTCKLQAIVEATS